MYRKNPGRITLLVVLSFFTTALYGQKLASFEVEFTRNTSGLDIPVSLDLDAVTYTADSLLSLYEVTGNKRTEIPFQIEQGDPRVIHWVIPTGT
ncbi:MAG: hypothetical protein IQL11_07410, partial [Bacteroidales bacterium]|nr:hypothetical protein [Bacteroidales bacterium]